ncbi:unnamed protein product [Cylicostephanus goldi]|uniref:Uncharacterized protein n=1 Tax=Cylicostephanus goldi TaxID=71465 RepID=A0A3P6TLI1_CYLGO|nr:unnamed protein product [Cylicostephanus goldi]
MLSDIFGEFVIDDDDVKDCVQFCTPEQYTAEIHDKGWFLAQSSSKNRTDDEKRELVYHRAAYHHYHKQFEDAVKVYFSIQCIFLFQG